MSFPSETVVHVNGLILLFILQLNKYDEYMIQFRPDSESLFTWKVAAIYSEKKELKVHTYESPAVNI